MCFFTQFVVKYVLITVNILFALTGLVIVGFGTYGHIQLNKIHDVIPVDLSFLSISIIVIGCIVFVISFCACCGAIQESRCMLVSYAVFMAILAAIKIYITVIIFKFLDNALQTVTNWLSEAFANENVRPGYNAMETLFSCCGTFGASSYLIIGQPIPSSCCWNGDTANQCTFENSYVGCNTRIGNYFEAFGGVIGIVLIIVIIVECVCGILGLFLSCQIGRKRYA